MVALTIGLAHHSGSLVPTRTRVLHHSGHSPRWRDLERTFKVVNQVGRDPIEPQQSDIIAFTGFDFVGGTFRQRGDDFRDAEALGGTCTVTAAQLVGELSGRPPASRKP
jgi:hypothetical protein